jgi:DNA-binding XRE family transcriptional regulator
MNRAEGHQLGLDQYRRLASKWAIDCGARVQETRCVRGLSRQELASTVGTTEATIHRVESGSINPRDFLKFAIAAALQVSAAELWPLPAQPAEMAGAA